MIITLVTEENAQMFLPVIPDDAFSISDVFFGAVDEETDTACGVLAAGADPERGFVINYIFVDEAYRHKGAGRALVDQVKQFAKELAVSGISCIHEVTTESDGVYELLKECGFEETPLPELTTYEAVLSDIHLPSKKATSRIVPIKELSDHQWRSYSSRVEALSKEDDSGLIVPLLERKSYDKDISWAYLNEDNRVMGAILVEALGEVISVDALRATAPEPAKVILDLLIGAVTATKKKFSKETTVLMNPHNSDHKLLLDKLSGGKAKKRADIVSQYFLL